MEKYSHFYLTTTEEGTKIFLEDIDTLCKLVAEPDETKNLKYRDVPEGKVAYF